jgi:K+-sensing histidine kinase KdpD
MIGKLVDLTSAICPFPHIINGKKFDGLSYSQPQKCIECIEIFCVKSIQEQHVIFTCPKEYNCYKYMIENKLILINGIYISGFSKKLSRKVKKSGVNQIKKDAIETWLLKSDRMIKALENAVHKNVSTTLGMLHDVKTSVSIIFRNAESLIYEEAGSTIDEKINNAPSNKKTLYKSVSLLEERLKMMSLVSNPESATHGDKNPIPIYKIFDRTIKIFQNLANKKHINIKLFGTSYSSPWIYSSFSTLPLVLIDNAIKYSQTSQDIIVTINDERGGVSVSVESFSLCIDKDDIQNIFKMNHRGKNADKVAIEGSGLGLYLADIVAYANGFKIEHTEKGNTCMLDGVQYATNIFSFFIIGSAGHDSYLQRTRITRR